MRALCAPDENGTARVAVHDRESYRRFGRVSGMTERYRRLEAVYGAGDVDPATVRSVAEARAAMRPWADQVDPADATSARWYEPADLAAAIKAWSRTPSQV
jgi:hypothetical protein